MRTKDNKHYIGTGLLLTFLWVDNRLNLIIYGCKIRSRKSEKTFNLIRSRWVFEFDHLSPDWPDLAILGMGTLSFSLSLIWVNVWKQLCLSLVKPFYESVTVRTISFLMIRKKRYEGRYYVDWYKGEMGITLPVTRGRYTSKCNYEA